MDKPYVRKLNGAGLPPAGTEKLGDFTVWLVDGTWVRANSKPDGDDFTNFGQHYRFSFIPMYEFWIDFYEANRSEQGFFIVHMLTEWKEQNRGASYDEAYDRSIELELRARAQYQDISPDVDPLQARVRMFHQLQNSMTIWLASEPFIHQHLSLNYVEGGHHLVPGYQWIPPDEIWVGATLPPLERLIICGHEIGEHGLMAKGMKYDPAHKKISKKELEVRDNPGDLMPWLQAEGW